MAKPPAEPLGMLDPHDRAQSAVLENLVADAASVDGQPPFSDQTLIDVRAGAMVVVTASIDGVVSGLAAVSTAESPRVAEIVVSPSSRRRGLGRALLAEVLRLTEADVLIWAHGDHPDARALAASHDLVARRELLQLRLEPVAQRGEAADVLGFRVGVDDTEWLEVNGRAFASHPEQGKITQADLDARIAEPWFDADDFLIARDDDGTMTGFCWLKVVDGDGEFYAVGVAPHAQGTGLGRRLVESGLARLIERRVEFSSLYVDGDNTAAVSLYRSVGFVDHTIDVQYAPETGSTG